MYKRVTIKHIYYNGVFFGAVGAVNALYNKAFLSGNLPSPFVVTEKYKEKIAVRFLLIDSFGRKLDVFNFKDVRRRGTGQPYILKNQSINISFSHDKDLCGVCISHYFHIGIDVQAVTNLSLGFKKRNRAICLNEERSSLFYCRAWAIQEAISKCMGTGLSSKPWEFSVHASNTCGKYWKVNWIILENLFPKYIIAIAYKEER